MKKFLKIVFLLTLIIVSIALLFVGNGYKMYKEAIEEISIEDKNVICEIKSFQKLKIFEKDEDLFRTKKQLDYIKVKVAVNNDEEIKFNKTINQKGTEEIERDISSNITN